MPRRSAKAAGTPQMRTIGRRPAQPAAPPDLRREQILTAAEHLFAEHGYERVTVRDVGEAAGVTHPLIYYYWDSKRGLLGAVLERNQQRVRSLVAQQSDPRETVLAIIRNYLGEGRLYLLIMARSFLGGMPVVDWPGGYPGMESAIDALLAAHPTDDPEWDQKVRAAVSLITALLCGWVLMGEQIMVIAEVAEQRRQRSSEGLLAAIDDMLRQTLAAVEGAGG
jgi:AcrR family transcriptional regulator